MTNTVCMEPKEVKSERLHASEMIGLSYDHKKTAFIGKRANTPSKKACSLWLVNRRSVFKADDPDDCSITADSFIIEYWVNIKIYVDEGECA